MDVVSVLQTGVEFVQLRGVDREGIKDAFIEVLMDSVVKVAGVTLAVVIHEELLRQDVPGDIRVQVPVSPHQLGDDVDVNTGVEVFQFLIFLINSQLLPILLGYLGEAEMGPDHSHVGVASEERVPNLQMLDLLEVDLRLVGAVKEAPVVRAQELFPPLMLPFGQLQLIVRNKTT